MCYEKLGPKNPIKTYYQLKVYQINYEKAGLKERDLEK